jgi:alpha-L-arabinofuranosidase
MVMPGSALLWGSHSLSSTHPKIHMTLIRICLAAVLSLPIFLRAEDAASAPAMSPPAGNPGGINETWGNPRDLPWAPIPTVEQEDGRGVAKISATKPEGSGFMVPLDVARLNGREVEIQTRVRADSVSAKPKPWNGVKIALRIRNADGTLGWPQFRLPVGTFGWTDVDWKVQIPDNPSAVDLNIGLDNVTGTVWFDAIHISTVPGAAGPSPAPATITVDATSSPGPVNRLVFGENVVSADDTGLWSHDQHDPYSIETGGGYWDPVKQAFIPAILEGTRQAGAALLRYPGGCNAHNYDWRKAVGPVETRGNWKFGIPEFLSLCQAVGAEPMFTMSDYLLPADEMPAHAAGLVEYLNAPATPDHPWAMKRKEWGHPDPYGVKFFELGNESYHGNHHLIPFRKYTPEQYAAYANATAAAMRVVDPSIKIGIVMQAGTGDDVETSDWDRTVIHLAGKSADFLIVHLYAPAVSGNLPTSDYIQTCLAVGEQSARHLDEFRTLALKESGRALPLAVTEYNGDIVDKEPVRFIYAQAMECADLMRIFLQPEHHVLGASYWEFINGLFSMLYSDRKAPDGGKLVEKPAYALYHLWTQHLGTRLAKILVDGPRASFAGAGSVYPATGDTYLPERSLGLVSLDGRLYSTTLKPGITGEGGTGGAFAVRFDGAMGRVYPELGRLPRPAGAGACDYAVSFEARFVPDPGSGAAPLGINLGDARGWAATHSMIGIEGIGTEWKAFQGGYHANPDTAEISLQAHLDFVATPVSGRLEVRKFKLEAFTSPQFPAYALLTACAMLSEDGKTLHLIVFNKSGGQDIRAQLHLAGFQAASARVWEVNGPGFAASDGVAETVHGDPLALSGATPTHLFPAHSMTAIDFVAQANPQTP